jgi:cell division protein FtsB
MTPRNTKHGASANTRRAASKEASRGASPSRTNTRDPKTAAPKAGKPKAARATKPARPEPSAWRWWLLPVVALVAGAVFVGTYYPVAKVQYRETRERARLEAELQGIRARNARLSTQVARLKTPEGVEDYAREQLGMVKAGETVGVVVDSEAASQTTTSVVSAAPYIDSEETLKPAVGPWAAFLDSVFGIQ